MNATREQKIRWARQLRSLGLKSPEIGRHLGVSESTVRNWCLGGDCVDCGAPIDGSNGVKSERCLPCRKAYEQTEQYSALRTWWTRARIIAAIQDWAAIYGEPPAIPDWNPHNARAMGDEARALRWEQARGRWPWFSSVVQRFGTWNAGIEAAGFAGRATGGGNGNQFRRRPRRLRTHCKYGHEFTDENTYVCDGRRYCRACNRRRAREYARRRGVGRVAA